MPVWDALRAARQRGVGQSFLSLFETHASPGGRAADFSCQCGEMLFDYSKTSIDTDSRALLLQLLTQADVAGAREAMFTGGKINRTENRAVLHSALRNLEGTPVFVEGTDVMPEVLDTLHRMQDFAEAVRSGRIQGQGGAITDVVNIGIGGSDLGPAMACRALSPYHDGPVPHFVSNVDGADIHDTLQGLNPETTLIIVASKTFATIETMTNAHTAQRWMAAKVTDPVRQFAALSSALDKTAAFGIDPARVFGFADWVGGRYSLWGPIGLSLMLAIGPERFRAFLAGGQAMDDHFRTAPEDQNMPMLLALVGIWHHQICGYASRAVLPYDQRLQRLPAYLQQLEMESNGKSVAMDGQPLAHGGGPLVWGEPGTNGQHAFFQLIHQGTQLVPCEFMVAANGHEDDLTGQHQLLLANCLAQSEALMQGRSLEQARQIMAERGLSREALEMQARHRVFPGNRPSTTLIYPKLTPFVLGQIIALYEHRVFVEGVILGLNSFDQWGVELGKELAKLMQPLLSGEGSAQGKDGSTRMLVDYIREKASS